MSQDAAEHQPDLGCAVLPVDSGIFGFHVGWHNPGQAPQGIGGEVFQSWMAEHDCCLLGTSVPASSPPLLVALQTAGFVCVDLSLTMTLHNTKRRPRQLAAASVRVAVPEDAAGIEEIADTAFDFGRYHRDPRFPREHANRRFSAWVAKELGSPQPGMKFFVCGEAGHPTAFMLVQVEEKRARWYLGGVSRTASNGLLGPMLFAAVLNEMEQAGIRSVTAKISAANTPVLNIYSALGFEAAQPEFTLHLHAPDSPHLLPPIL